jgi:hypothetical protein
VINVGFTTTGAAAFALMAIFSSHPQIRSSENDAIRMRNDQRMNHPA